MIVGGKSEINQVVAGIALKFCSPTVLVHAAGFGYYFYEYRARSGCMVQRVATVAFEGIEARVVDVQVQVAPGLPAFYAGALFPFSIRHIPTSGCRLTFSERAIVTVGN